MSSLTVSDLLRIPRTLLNKGFYNLNMREFRAKEMFRQIYPLTYLDTNAGFPPDANLVERDQDSAAIHSI